MKIILITAIFPASRIRGDEREDFKSLKKIYIYIYMIIEIIFFPPRILYIIINEISEI